MAPMEWRAIRTRSMESKMKVKTNVRAGLSLCKARQSGVASSVSKALVA
jgi:hypothetical protein